jgi:hypothetical protein
MNDTKNSEEHEGLRRAITNGEETPKNNIE